MIVDGAILDVSSFSQRHPGGARVIHNAVGTDVTYELLGHNLSVGHAMSFSPHQHSQVRWTDQEAIGASSGLQEYSIGTGDESC